MWSHRDPSIRKSGVGNIFIKNLDKAIDNKGLYDTFSVFGNILSCKVEVDEHGNSKGYGYVHYETQEAADSAIARVNNMLLNDKLVYVGTFIPKKDRRPANPSEVFTNVYVKNLDDSCDEEKLREIFSKFGAVDSCVVMRDNGKSRCFGFVNFHDHESAQKAVENVSSEKLTDKPLVAARAQKKAEREARLRDKFKKLKEERMSKYQGVNLYIKNLDDTIDEEKLKAEFASFGTITSAKIMTDDKSNSRGFGFVCFSKPEEATKAVNDMNGRMLASKPIYVALAQPKEIRRAQLEASHSQRQQGMRMQQPMPMPLGYPGGAPVFYPQPGMPPAAGRQFVYPQQMMPGRRWTPQPAGRPPYTMPNYNVAPGQRQPRPPGSQGSGSGRGGRGGVPGGQVGGQGAQAGGAPGGNPRSGPNSRRGGKYNNQGRARTDAAAVGGDAITDLTPTRLAQASPEDRRQVLGDALFPLIHAQQPSQAAKITGMILEATDAGELLHLITDPPALNDKITEALQILRAHSEQQQSTEPSDAVATEAAPAAATEAAPAAAAPAAAAEQ
jgi:polyadenylate-binding protein